MTNEQRAREILKAAYERGDTLLTSRTEDALSRALAEAEERGRREEKEAATLHIRTLMGCEGIYASGITKALEFMGNGRIAEAKSTLVVTAKGVADTMSRALRAGKEK